MRSWVPMADAARGRPQQTTALPYFHRPLARLVTAMNQNTVKVETASAVTFLERETLAKLHHAFYAQEPAFYATHAHRAEACLGAITSGGTLANLTALWCARNAALGTVAVPPRRAPPIDAPRWLTWASQQGPHQRRPA